MREMKIVSLIPVYMVLLYACNMVNRAVSAG
jgi:hypothetical protein